VRACWRGLEVMEGARLPIASITRSGTSSLAGEPLPSLASTLKEVSPNCPAVAVDVTNPLVASIATPVGALGKMV